MGTIQKLVCVEAGIWFQIWAEGQAGRLFPLPFVLCRKSRSFTWVAEVFHQGLYTVLGLMRMGTLKPVPGNILEFPTAHVG